MNFPILAPERREQMLALPTGQITAVLDTDTYNEIDDQFALVYALLAEQVDLKAVYAAPFFNRRSSGPGDGMERSYDEILRVMDRLGLGDPGMVYKGSPTYLISKNAPVYSPAAEDLVAQAKIERDGPLYVLTIGCITNIASALLMAPKIVERIVVVWLGGHPWYWPHTREFNLQQDVPAAQVVFDSGVPMVQIPCKNVSEHLRTTLPEMASFVKGRGAIGDYLYQIFEGYHDNHYAYSKVIWDISSVAYVVNSAWVPTELRPSPVLRDDITWGPEDASRHPIRVATDVNRDAVFGDIFRRIEAHAHQYA
jgi:inosine-uridine nucleoside N-ribohydrolase